MNPNRRRRWWVTPKGLNLFSFNHDPNKSKEISNQQTGNSPGELPIEAKITAGISFNVKKFLEAQGLEIIPDRYWATTIKNKPNVLVIDLDARAINPPTNEIFHVTFSLETSINEQNRKDGAPIRIEIDRHPPEY